MISRAFDIGCAVGRSTFELARGFDEVIGLDYSKAFIARCQELKMMGQADYSVAVEGDLTENKTAVVDPAIVSCECVCGTDRSTCLCAMLSLLCAVLLAKCEREGRDRRWCQGNLSFQVEIHYLF